MHGDVRDLLEDAIKSIEEMPEKDRPMNGVVIFLAPNGAWGGSMYGISPFGATALLEFAKADLVSAGNNWSVFGESPAAANSN